jgi:hypothetical protein
VIRRAFQRPRRPIGQGSQCVPQQFPLLIHTPNYSASLAALHPSETLIPCRSKRWNAIAICFPPDCRKASGGSILIDRDLCGKCFDTSD